MTNQKKIFFYFLFFCLTATSLLTFAKEPKEMEPASKYCEKVTGVSKGFAEDVARKKKVSVGSVSVLRAVSVGAMGCSVTFDTAAGPLECTTPFVYSDGKKFWVGGLCF